MISTPIPRMSLLFQDARKRINLKKLKHTEINEIKSKHTIEKNFQSQKLFFRWNVMEKRTPVGWGTSLTP